MSAARPETTGRQVALAAIGAADAQVGAFIERAGFPADRPGQGDAFSSLARAIVFQQLAGRAAAAIHGRFVDAIGGAVAPAAVLGTPEAALRAAGLSAAKTASLVDLATRALDGSVPLDDLGALDDDAIVERLVQVRGIGRWTAEMFLLFELRRPDVWPVDDYGVRNGWGLIHELPDLIRPRALHAEGERFRPHRSTVALLCWHAVNVARAGQ
jgi:DNA-3-methyladenine glycosylase II